MVVEVQDVEACALGRYCDCQVGQWGSVSAVRAGACQLTDRRQHIPLDAAIDRDLA